MVNEFRNNQMNTLKELHVYINMCLSFLSLPVFCKVLQDMKSIGDPSIRLQCQ